MKSIRILSTLFVLAHLALGQVIISIETKTSEDQDAGMTLGNIDLEIYAQDFSYCSISKLDGDGDDFRPGAINVFEGSELDSCDHFMIPNHIVSLLRLEHSGLDAWKCDWIRIIYDDNTYSQCADGREIDNSQVHNLNCSNPVYFPKQ